MSLVVPAGWLAAQRARADQPPRKPRVPLWTGDARIGSVEPDFLAAVPMGAGLVEPAVNGGEQGWRIQGELTASLRQVALAMREAGVAHVWRDEQLAVTDGEGRKLGTVERAVVRPLGITTFAVHLAGISPDGGHWLQQRSLTKPNDPGLWDTLMGGMIPASDSMEQALERETWEEAGLRLSQIEQLRYRGRMLTRRPSDESSAGYIVEYLDWYSCVVPSGVAPTNQDGEVAQFRLMRPEEVARRMQRDEFTLEAALILST
ncbi:NUDIX hydrolase [Caenimonas soli]|uniref:NUDIX hydrolase n=1 Tax=Caenimonas soli TaxID=2735555 RepID=UPI001552F16F|nr:NUDIX domain-containing protein [Caenimonas soli]NPC54701.1 NUDIX domain-containing protein [Caenimonas soli]